MDGGELGGCCGRLDELESFQTPPIGLDLREPVSWG